MVKTVLSIIFVFILGFFGSYFGMRYFGMEKNLRENNTNLISQKNSQVTKSFRREVIGFLPFWLINSSKTDYSEYMNHLSIFSLVVDSDGSIKKYTKPTEGEPGYFSLVNGKFNEKIKIAKDNKMKLSLVLFSGDDSDIDTMLEDPVNSAKNLTSDILPLANQYEFDEINLDIEKVSDASESARLKFAQFVKEVRNITNENNLTLTIDVMASSFVKKTNLVNPFAIAQYVDGIIVMAYDYHYIGSYVTGAVAPLSGAGVISEFDVETAINEATREIDPSKIILGIPLYGYEWESIGNTPRSAIIPSTGLIISNSRAEEFLDGCTNCEVKFNQTDQEMNIIYKDQNTGLYHQIFYPEIKSMQSKLNLAEKYNLGGVALWALGYEGETILQPLSGWSR